MGGPSEEVRPMESDELIVYDTFVKPADDGTFEAWVMSSGVRQWFNRGYATEAEASIAAFRFALMACYEAQS